MTKNETVALDVIKAARMVLECSAEDTASSTSSITREDAVVKLSPCRHRLMQE